MHTVKKKKNGKRYGSKVDKQLPLNYSITSKYFIDRNKVAHHNKDNVADQSLNCHFININRSRNKQKPMPLSITLV